MNYKLKELLFENKIKEIHKILENEENKFSNEIDIQLSKNIKLNLSPNIQNKILEKMQDVLKDFDFNFQLYDNTDTQKFKNNFLQTWKEEVGVDTAKNSLFNLLTPTFKIKLDNNHFIKSLEVDLYRNKNDLGHDETGITFKFSI